MENLNLIEGGFISKKGEYMMNWGNVKSKYINIAQFNDIVKELKSNDYKQSRCYKIKNIIWFFSRFIEYQTDSSVVLCYIDKKTNEAHKYIVKLTVDNEESTADTNEVISGMDAYIHIEELWQSFNNKKETLYRYYSGQNYIKQYKLIKHCVPVQISYINDYIKDTVVDNCYKADISSAFPSQLLKDIPTLHNCKEVKGFAEPDPEYPFAFYTKSGHINIYNELDTRNWKNSAYYRFNDRFTETNEEITILCKKAEINMKEVFEYLYENRKQYPEMKLWMNACIGYFHRNQDPRLSHIAAVTIARNNQRMINYCNLLKDEDNHPLYIATDSIVWLGKESSIAVKEKYLGSFTYESHNNKFFGKDIGAYQMYLDDGSLLTKATYIKNGEAKDTIPFGELPDSKKSRYALSGGKLIQIL